MNLLRSIVFITGAAFSVVFGICKADSDKIATNLLDASGQNIARAEFSSYEVFWTRDHETDTSRIQLWQLVSRNGNEWCERSWRFTKTDSFVDPSDWQNGKSHDVKKAVHEDVRICNDDYFADLNLEAGARYNLNELSGKADDWIEPSAWYRLFTINGSHLTHWQIFESRVSSVKIVEETDKGDGITSLEFRSKIKQLGETIFEISLAFDSQSRLVLAGYKSLGSPDENGAYTYRYDSRNAVPSSCKFLGTARGKRFSRSWVVRNMQEKPSTDRSVFRLPYYGIPEPKEPSRWRSVVPLVIIAIGATLVLLSTRMRRSV